MDVFQRVRFNMQRIRHEKSLSQEEVARRLGMAQGHYSVLERRGRPTLATLVRIAEEGLECPLEDLFVRPEQVELHDRLRVIGTLPARSREEIAESLDAIISSLKPSGRGRKSATSK